MLFAQCIRDFEAFIQNTTRKQKSVDVLPCACWRLTVAMLDQYLKAKFKAVDYTSQRQQTYEPRISSQLFELFFGNVNFPSFGMNAHTSVFSTLLVGYDSQA